jgi:hypothetical protein
MLNSFHVLKKNPSLVQRDRPISKKRWQAWHFSFRWKYTAFLVGCVFGTVALFLGAAFYEIHQNYDLFKQLAFDTHPRLVEGLERELIQFGFFVGITLLATFTFCFVFGFKLTKVILNPLIHLEGHMKKVIQGNWKATDFRFNSHGDMSEFFDTYSYMYRSLRAHTESEIKLLERLVVDPNDRESVAIQKKLIQQKRDQLGLSEEFLPSASNVVEISQPPASRRAS